ncbi:MAG: hypothetical protein ACFFAO_12835, partial [Candidatus Hermodarchaeota archaeon]
DRKVEGWSYPCVFLEYYMRDGTNTFSTLRVSVRLSCSACDEIQKESFQRRNFRLCKQKVGGNHGALSVGKIKGS